ncbi:MAG: sel1 repeat family protein [Parachlamydiaceae bacterium]|nr:sel1 repeat family protein [Parachlamydiaceae bacterium]
MISAVMLALVQVGRPMREMEEMIVNRFNDYAPWGDLGDLTKEEGTQLYHFFSAKADSKAYEKPDKLAFTLGLGMCHLKGIGAEKDPQVALKVFTLAVEKFKRRKEKGTEGEHKEAIAQIRWGEKDYNYAVFLRAALILESPGRPDKHLQDEHLQTRETMQHLAEAGDYHAVAFCIERDPQFFTSASKEQRWNYIVALSEGVRDYAPAICQVVEIFSTQKSYKEEAFLKEILQQIKTNNKDVEVVNIVDVALIVAGRMGYPKGYTTYARAAPEDCYKLLEMAASQGDVEAMVLLATTKWKDSSRTAEARMWAQRACNTGFVTVHDKKPTKNFIFPQEEIILLQEGQLEKVLADTTYGKPVILSGSILDLVYPSLIKPKEYAQQTMLAARSAIQVATQKAIDFSLSKESDSVIISKDGERIPVHSGFLLGTNVPFSDKGTSSPEQERTNYSSYNWYALLQVLYTGNLPWGENITALNSMAVAYGIPAVQKLCNPIMEKMRARAVEALTKEKITGRDMLALMAFRDDNVSMEHVLISKDNIPVPVHKLALARTGLPYFSKKEASSMAAGVEGALDLSIEEINDIIVFLYVRIVSDHSTPSLKYLTRLTRLHAIAKQYKIPKLMEYCRAEILDYLSKNSMSCGEAMLNYWQNARRDPELEALFLEKFIESSEWLPYAKHPDARKIYEICQSNQENPAHATALAVCLQRGIGTEQNREGALKILSSVYKTYPPAMYEYANLISEEKEKRELMCQAAERGYVPAMMQISDGVAAGIQHGSILAHVKLAKKAKEVGDSNLVIQSLVQAAARGHMESCSMLAKGYFEGVEPMKMDDNLAHKYFKMAAEFGTPKELLDLAEYYLRNSTAMFQKEYGVFTSGRKRAEQEITRVLQMDPLSINLKRRALELRMKIEES